MNDSHASRPGWARRDRSLAALLLAPALLAGAGSQGSLAASGGRGAPAAGDDPVIEKHAFTPGSLLEIDLEAGGSAIIMGRDEPGAEIAYFDRLGDLRNHAIRIDERRGGLRITAEAASRSHRSQDLVFEISVPHRVDVIFHSSGGSLTLRDLEGSFEGQSGGGSLALTGVTGDADLATGGGAIEIVDCTLDGRITTGGGEVVVRDVVGNVEVTSGGGEVHYHNVRDRDGRLRGPDGLSLRGMDEETVVIASAGGGIDVDRAPAGAIVSTGGGDLDIDGADRFVEAKTGGGDIAVRVADGWVRASTGAGDIRVEVEKGLGDTDDGLDLSTGMGTVTVYLPRGLSLDIRLEIRYTRNSRRDYVIDSNLDLDVRESESWEYEHGSPTRTIRGRAVIGDGEHRVRIRTVNGDIRLRVAE